MLGHVIFLGLFYAVLAVISATLALSLFRARARFPRPPRRSHLLASRPFRICPARERVCRHDSPANSASHLRQSFRLPRVPDACRPGRQASAGRRTGTVAKAEVFGLDFPLDRFYHRGHAWAHPEPDGTVTVGLDALGARLVADPDAIELPAVGAHIQTNGAAWHVRKRGANVRILSPVDGEVVATGGAQDGWDLKVKPDGGKLDDRHLLRGAEIRPWIARELERLQLALAPAGQTLTMADGGVPMDDIAAGYPEADWDAVCGEIFLQA